MYDNISGNTGDVAIGLSIKKILYDIGVEFDELVPGKFNPNDYDTIIIGGGHLIRHSPDFFYDKFKVPGNHILNAVGILGSPDDLDYLNNYKYITVRSSWDKEKLSYLKKEVYVVPCTTMLLEDLDDIPVSPKDNSIGIHLLPNIFSEDEEREFIEWISGLPFHIYFIPITHYNQDYIYMMKLNSKIQNSELLPLMNPLEIFTFIGKLDYFIGCSLHGGIFSYRHKVPFILLNYNEKMLYFMKDRGYEQYTFTNFKEMQTSFESLLNNPPDYTEMINRDLKTIQTHTNILHDIFSSVGSREQKRIVDTKDSSLEIYQINNLQSQLRTLVTGLKKADNHRKFLELGLFERDERIANMNNLLLESENSAHQLETEISERDERIANMDNLLLESENSARQLETEISERDERIADLNNSLLQSEYRAHQLETEISERDERIAKMNNNKLRKLYNLGLTGWKLTIDEGPKKAISEFHQYIIRNALKIGRINSENNIDGLQMLQFRERDYITSLFSNLCTTSSEYVPEKQDHITLNESDLKIIAFYLPQYHPIPENDRWWGKGFTDWRNVAKALPQFIGHYQPHLPDELGYYDLRLPEVQARQVEIAKKYGIYGFCFYYYWFEGKRLLERPLDQLINNPEIDFKFCICWANENWTRRWDGAENEVLISQTHSPDNDLRFIDDIERILRDPRYIRIEGRPVLIVYRLSLLPDAKATAERWRTYCKDKGLGDLYLIAAQTFGFENPYEQGFDAAVEFPPHKGSLPGMKRITNNCEIMNFSFEGEIADYDDFVKSKEYLKNVNYKLFKTACPGWDNTARRPNNATILYGSNPANFKEWLMELSDWTFKVHPPGERLIFINAWNEWAEGAHLEPDRKYGYGYLQSVSEVVRSSLYRER